MMGSLSYGFHFHLRSSSECFNLSSINVAMDTPGAIMQFFYGLFEVQTQATSQPDLMHLSVTESSTACFIAISEGLIHGINR